jgi:exonuclease III
MSRVRLAVWNIRQGGGERIAGIAQALENIDADVCILSEFTERRGAALTSALRERGFRNSLHTSPEGAWGGVLVAARIPIHDAGVANCPSPHRWLHVAGEGLPFEIGAAYMPNAERSPTEKRTYWDWLLATSQAIFKRPFIICGDLNTALPYVDEDAKTISCSDAMLDLVNLGWVDL